jgi:hypothetical protein
MSSSDAQKSEVHDTTADADASPTSSGDQATTRKSGTDKSRETPKRELEGLSPGTRIVRDDTSDGGPLVVESNDPDLNPPRTPKDPFPTERTPEIDPPVKRDQK